MNVNIYRGDLQACRVCLATDIKLISLHDFSLKRTYSVFSGVPITPTDGLPQHICVFCCALLKKYSDFKEKCKATYVFLSRHLCDIHALTTSYINTLDRSNYRIPLSITNILECNCIPDEDGLQNTETISISDEEPADFDCLYEDSGKDHDYCLKNEDFVLVEEGIKHIKKESAHKIIDDTDDNLKNEDFALEEGAIYNFEKESAHNIDDETLKQEDNFTADTILGDNKKRIEDFKINYFNQYMDSDKESFYCYILEKYVTKSKKQFIHDLSENISHVNASEVPAFISLDKDDLIDDLEAKIEMSSQNKNQEKLYEYINNKYINGNISAMKQKKAIDILRRRKRKNKGDEKYLAKFCEDYNFDVVLMLREEKVKDLLMRKETDNYKKSKYKCELCFMGFATQIAFQNHKARHDDPSLAFECEFCRVRFKSNKRLKHHFTVQHRHKFVCRKCGLVLKTTSKVREHYNRHIGRSYICEFCGKSFNKYASRINHIRIHHGNVPCEICHMKFTGESGLATHKVLAHKEIFKCPTCLIQFHNANALRRHAEITVDGCGTHIKPCTQCGISFSDDQDLKSHMFEVHPPDRHRPENKRIFAPRVRHPTIPGKAGIYRKGENQEELICEICAMGGFKFPWALRDHQRRKHSDERPCVCDYCKKTFKSRTDIRNHIVHVHGGRRYSCPLPNCSRAYRQHHHLTAHLRAHSSEKAFSCDICERPFKHPESLREHERIVHEGKPPPPRRRNKKPM